MKQLIFWQMEFEENFHIFSRNRIDAANSFSSVHSQREPYETGTY